MLADKHIDADYFHPERTLAIRAAQEHATKDLYSARLQDIVHFLRDLVPADSNPNYLGLASVQGNTGELVPNDEEVAGNCFAFATGDVLFARLRPYLNKVHCAEQDGICSPEFHVMRPRAVAETGIEVLPDYLAVVLRSSLVLAQTRHMMTGNTHPRLSNEDVANIVVAVPKNIQIQEEITREVKRRKERARALRAEAGREWEAAKAAFERRLLGGDA